MAAARPFAQVFVDKRLAADEEEVADVVFDANVNDIAGFLKGDAVALAGVELVAGEAAEAALGVADIGDGELEVAGAAVVEDFDRKLEKGLLLRHNRRARQSERDSRGFGRGVRLGCQRVHLKIQIRQLLLLELGEDFVGFFEAFFGADVEPDAWDAPGIDGGAGVEPLDETAGLVGVVAFGDVLADEGKGGLGIIVEGDAGQGAGWVLGFFFEEGDFAGGVEGNGVVFFDFFEAADIINGQNGGVASAAVAAKIFEALAEEVVAGDDDEIVLDVFAREDEVEVADGAEFVGVVGGAVVDDGEVRVWICRRGSCRTSFWNWAANLALVTT